MDASPAEPTAASAAPVACAHCGATAGTAPLDWLLEVDPRRGRVWVCDRCARTHLRSIEAKLDREWW
jgi:hypothetical protein